MMPEKGRRTRNVAEGVAGSRVPGSVKLCISTG